MDFTKYFYVQLRSFEINGHSMEICTRNLLPRKNISSNRITVKNEVHGIFAAKMRQ